MVGKAYGSDSGGSPYRSSSFAFQIVESVSCLSPLFLFSGTHAFPLKSIDPHYSNGQHGPLPRIGAIVVPTNPLYVERELEYQLNDSGARAAVVFDQLAPQIKERSEADGG